MKYFSFSLQPTQSASTASASTSTSKTNRTERSASPQPAKRVNAMLQGLKRRLRPSAPSVIVGPGYTYTSIAPLQTAPEAAQPLSTAAPASPAKFSSCTTQWLKTRAEGLTHKLHPPAHSALASQRPDAVRATGSALAFASTVEALFARDARVPCSAANEAPIRALIDELIASAPEPSAETAHVRFAGALQCARALSAATDGNAAQALVALHHLRHRFSLDISFTPADEAARTEAAERHAWRSACLLSRTSNGFDALIALRNDPALNDTSENGAMKRESLRTFLQAAAHLAESRLASEADPGNCTAQWRTAVERLARTPDPANAPNALALNALLCAAKVHAAPHASAEQIGDAAQVAAYVAWRSGYRENGAGSPLSRTQGRMAKFMTWIRRAEQRATQRRAAFDPRRLAGIRKSPLTATAYGAGGANLGLASGEAKALHDTLQTALDAVSAHLGALLQGRGLTPEQRGVLLLRQQCLARWKAAAKQSPSSMLALSARDRETIAATVSTHAPRAGLNARTVLAGAEFAGLKKLDLKTLERWSHEAAALGPRPDEAADPHGQIEQVRKLERASPIRPAGATRAALQAALVKVIDTTRLGNNVRYFDGGTYGVNVNSTLNLADFKAMLGVSGGPGVKVLRGRHAFLEIGSSSYGGEVFMGTETRSSSGASLSAFGGVAFGLGSCTLHATLSGGAGIAYSHDRSAPSGVIIRTQLRRDADGKVTDSWRAQANDVVGFLFEQRALAQAAGPIAPERLWQHFSARFFRARDISVNWRDQRRSSHTVSKVGTAMARVGVAGWHAGPALNASHDSLLAGKNERVDANGWLRGVERSRARSSALTINGSLVAASVSPGDFSSRVEHPQSVSLPSVPIIGASAALIPSGASVTLRMVDEHGRPHPRYIRRLVEFVDPRLFISYLETQRASIAHSETSNARLNSFIREVRAAATRGNQAFGESLKIRLEAAETLSAYRDEIEMIRHCTAPTQDASSRKRDETQIALLDAEIARLLNDPQSWKVSGYYTYEINTRGYAAGPSFIAQAMAMTSASGERVLAELAVSELEALDDPESSAHGGAHAEGIH